MLPPPNGSSATVTPPSPRGSHAQPGTLSSSMSTDSATCPSHTCSWTKFEPGSVVPHRCSGCGWPLIPARKFFRCFSSAPARNTWRMYSSTLSDRAWPPFCIPLFTSDGLNLYFYALTAHFGQWLALGRRGRLVRQWQVEPSLIYGQVEKC